MSGRDRGSDEPSAVLVIKHGAFGDVIQSDGALRDIREQQADAVVTVLTTAPYRRIFERCPWVDHVLVDERAPRWRLDQMAALGRRLRGGHFARVFDLQNSTRTAFYRRWLLPGVSWAGETRRTTWRLRAEPQRKPSLERMADQLRASHLVPTHTFNPDVSWMGDEVGPILAASDVREPFVVLIPGSSARHPQKRWPRYGALAQALIERGFGVVTAPGPDEGTLASTLPGVVLTGPAGFLNWFELAGLFRRAAFVVGNDTGPTHLAAHSGARGLALFGAHTSPAMTGILRPNFSAIAVPDLQALPVERVLSVVVERLASQGLSGNNRPRPEEPTKRGHLEG